MSFPRRRRIQKACHSRAGGNLQFKNQKPVLPALRSWFLRSWTCPT